MVEFRLFLTLLLIILFFPVQACTGTENEQEKSVFKQLPELKEIKPQKPVKIKLKRNASGSYSWELSGDDADKIIESDKKLRDALEK